MKRLTILLLVILTSCTISYKFNGAAIDYNTTKTISIAEFPIRAALVYPPLGPAFNEALKDIYTRQTRLSMVKTGGDLQVEGEITGYDLSRCDYRQHSGAAAKGGYAAVTDHVAGVFALRRPDRRRQVDARDAEVGDADHAGQTRR